MLMKLKKAYWQAWQRWNNWRRPRAVVLSPHDPFDAMRAFLPKDKQSLVFVDAGAHDGVVARQFHDRLGPMAIHAFEPNTDLHPQLHRQLAPLAGCVYSAALGGREGEATFHLNSSPMTSSLLEPAAFSKRHFADAIGPERQVTVSVLTLDAWARKAGIDRIDVLKLDLQGYEVEALRGATHLLECGIDCIYTEVSFVPFYEGGALFSDVDRLLRSHDYRLHNLYHLATHTCDGQLGGADALYVLDEHHPARLQAQRQAA